MSEVLWVDINKASSWIVEAMKPFLESHAELIEALKLARPYVHADDDAGIERALDVLEKIDAALKKAGAL